MRSPCRTSVADRGVGDDAPGDQAGDLPDQHLAPCGVSSADRRSARSRGSTSPRRRSGTCPGCSAGRRRCRSTGYRFTWTVEDVHEDRDPAAPGRRGSGSSISIDAHHLAVGRGDDQSGAPLARRARDRGRRRPPRSRAQPTSTAPIHQPADRTARRARSAGPAIAQAPTMNQSPSGRSAHHAAAPARVR